MYDQCFVGTVYLKAIVSSKPFYLLSTAKTIPLPKAHSCEGHMP